MTSYESSSNNVLEVTVETNTPKGGDTGHGGITTFQLRDVAGTDIKCSWNEKERCLCISLGGDSEAETFIDCIGWAYRELSRQQIKNTGLE